MTAPLVITLFGPMQVSVEGQPLPRLRSRKALWLLALLTLRHDRPVEREWLAGTLWPDADQDQAFANLRVVLSELRKALGSQGGRLKSPSRHTLSLELSGAEVDVLAFDKAIAGNTQMAQAVALYTGPLLEGCAEEWVGQERRKREEDCLRALQTLADSALAAGDSGAASGYFRQAIALDPWRDAARRGLMEALAQGGDRNAALQVYREFLEVLRSDARAVPDDETSALYRRLRKEARRTAAGPLSVSAAEAVPSVVNGYLPHPLTDLVGREDERLEVAARLRRSRLVTLTGPGGIGKTRLALAVAAETAAEYANGVWLIALESLTAGSQVDGQVAAVLGLKEENGQTTLQTLTNHLRGKQVLLVLDNCEHLLDACARLVEHLLRECAGVRVAATSREPLGIAGEIVWRVPALATPDPAHLPPGPATLVRVLPGYESVQLFVERAQAAQSSFSLTGSNALAVAQVCAHLEGIPLAIELAAARVRVLTVEQIVTRFNDYLSLLTGSTRTAQTRQQTLRATLGWSYSLLGESERRLLGRLSVFSGGWSLDAAEQVCAGDSIQPGRVLDLLTSLVDKSLVVFVAWETGGRYRLLEMVRQYAAEWLEKDDAAEKVKARHRDFFLALAEEAEPYLKGSEQGVWLRRLDTEIGNLRAALAWCGTEPDGAEAGLKMAGALWQFWELRGYYNEGRTSLLEALQRTESEKRTERRAKALYAAGVLAFYQGDYGAARSLHEQGLTVFREMGDSLGTARSLKDLGRLAGAQGDYAAARALYEESLTISQGLGDLQGSGWLLNDLGNIASVQGDYEAARTFHQESLAISQQLGDTEGIAWSVHHLGGVASVQGDYGAARVLHEESLAIFQSLEHKQGAAWSLNYLGNVAFVQGDFGAAQALCQEGLAVFRELGNKQGIAWSLNDLGKAASMSGDSGAAWVFHQESLTIFRELGEKRGIAASLRGLAALLPLTNRKAAQLWGAAESLLQSIGAQLFFHEKERYNRQVAIARAALGEEAFAAAWQEGRALTLEQAAADALKTTSE